MTTFRVVNSGQELEAWRTLYEGRLHDEQTAREVYKRMIDESSHLSRLDQSQKAAELEKTMDRYSSGEYSRPR